MKLMKGLMPMAILAMVACTSVDVQVEQDVDGVKGVCFRMDNLSVDYATRATLSSAGCTDVYVWEGTTLLAHKKSTDADFSAPTINLTYGEHSLTFIASKATGQDFSEGLWRCTKVLDTFGKVLSVNVTGSTGSRDVEMSRRSAQVKFGIEDNIPSGVKTMHITCDNNLALDASLTGDDACTLEITTDISDKVGSTYNPTINILTASATDEEEVDVMIEFKNASGVVLYKYERTLQVKANRVTNLHGKYFSGNANNLSVSADWDTQVDVDL